LCLFLDLYRFALLGVGRGSSLEHAVKITAALASHALTRGHRVQLVAGGRDEVRVPPGKAKGHLGTILDALVEVRPNGKTPFDDFLDARVRAVSSGTTVVFPVSPYLYGSKKFQRQLTRLQRQGVRVVLIVFDSATFRNLYDMPENTESAQEYAAHTRALGMHSFVVPCSANFPAIFAGSPALSLATVGAAP
jgi:uncharacterized protein (DUF58 family)